jgi:hypothetical protein
MDIQARFIFPIRVPFTNSESLIDSWEVATQQLNGFESKITSPILRSDISFSLTTSSEISSEDKARFRKLYRNKAWIKLWTKAHAYIACEFTIPLKDIAEIKTIFANDELSRSDDAILAVCCQSVANKIDAFIFDMTVAGNIALLGGLSFHDGMMITGLGVLPLDSYSGWFNHGKESADEYGWPQIENAGIREVFHWYGEIPGATAGHSSTPVSRAVCAFTYLLSRSVLTKTMSELVWSLTGIEALLGEADQSRRLITEKLLLIFPPKNIDQEKNIRKLIKDLYDFRSRMLHGNRNISSQRLELENETDDPRKYLLEEWRATSLSIAILSQLILKCFKNNLSELKTKLVLDF